jgi:hypothetical protein
MEIKDFKPGDFVKHILIHNVKLLIVQKSEKYTDYYFCRYFSGITGSFHLEEFHGFELSLIQQAL